MTRTTPKSRASLGAMFVLFGLILLFAGTNVGIVLIVIGALIAVLALAGYKTPSDAARGRKMA